MSDHVFGVYCDARNESTPGLGLDQLQTTHAALARAWGPSVGTICLSALLQAIIGSLALALRSIRWVRSIAPYLVHS